MVTPIEDLGSPVGRPQPHFRPERKVQSASSPREHFEDTQFFWDCVRYLFVPYIVLKVICLGLLGVHLVWAALVIFDISEENHCVHNKATVECPTPSTLYQLDDASKLSSRESRLLSPGAVELQADEVDATNSPDASAFQTEGDQSPAGSLCEPPAAVVHGQTSGLNSCSESPGEIEHSYSYRCFVRDEEGVAVPVDYELQLLPFPSRRKPTIGTEAPK